MLPDIIPQARDLFTSGFGRVAFAMAHVYALVRLLPADHPYLKAENIGKFGLTHVIAQAANNLKFTRSTIDQVIVFIILLFAILLLFGQIALLLFTLIFQPALADNLLSYFSTPLPQSGGASQDLAFIMMDQVFGVPDFFCAHGGGNQTACTDVLNGNRWPFHVALHEMLRFYSLGLLLIAFVIFTYFIIVVVGETATSGKPFGQRFQNVWVPIRLVLALGLLTPVQYGLNSAQYITLYAAKFGSSFATNAWLGFNDSIASNVERNANPAGSAETLIARPTTPDLTEIVKFMTLVHGCAYDHWRMYGSEVKEDGTVVNNNDLLYAPPTTQASSVPANAYIVPYFVKSANPLNTPEGTSEANMWQEERKAMDYNADPISAFKEAVKFFYNGDIIIRFGRFSSENIQDPPSPQFSGYLGGIESTCGEVRIPVTDLKNIGNGTSVGGAAMMQEFYFTIIYKMWFDHQQIIDYSHRSIEAGWTDLACEIGCNSNSNLPSCQGSTPQEKPCMTERPDAKARRHIIDKYNVKAVETGRLAWKTYLENTEDIEIQEKVLDKGWAGAGIWYNTIAQINGHLIDGVRGIPLPVSYPLVMEKVRKEKIANETKTTPLDIYEPKIAGSKKMKSLSSLELQSADRLYKIYEDWHREDPKMSDKSKPISGEVFEGIVNLIFGTNFLFEMNRGDNVHVHPMAQLSSLGKGIVDSTITNIAVSTGGSAISSLLGKHLGAAASLASSIAESTIFIGLTAGIILFYILPILPFVYFFFAVSSWIKGIFEAMVGTPLWALGHMRIEGEGLFGPNATAGYGLLFEIFLRPILTLVGLIAAMIIFTAQVRILSAVWKIAIENVGGFEGDQSIGLFGENLPLFDSNGEDTGDTTTAGLHINRSSIDQLFFTATYAIIVYMMAISSFKMINRVPSEITRWMHLGVTSFADSAKEANIAETLSQKVGQGGMTIGQSAVTAFQGLGKQSGALLGQMAAEQKAKETNTPPPPTQPPKKPEGDAT